MITIYSLFKVLCPLRATVHRSPWPQHRRRRSQRPWLRCEVRQTRLSSRRFLHLRLARHHAGRSPAAQQGPRWSPPRLQVDPARRRNGNMLPHQHRSRRSDSEPQPITPRAMLRPMVGRRWPPRRHLRGQFHYRPVCWSRN